MVWYFRRYFIDSRLNRHNYFNFLTNGMQDLPEAARTIFFCQNCHEISIYLKSIRTKFSGIMVRYRSLRRIITSEVIINVALVAYYGHSACSQFTTYIFSTLILIWWKMAVLLWFIMQRYVAETTTSITDIELYSLWFVGPTETVIVLSVAFVVNT